MVRIDLFKSVLDFIENDMVNDDDVSVIDAKMRNYSDDIEIVAETEFEEITVRVSIKYKEDENDQIME